MEIIVSLFGIIFGLLFLTIIIASFFIWIGVKLVGINNASFGKSVLAAIATSVSAYFFTLILSVFPIVGTVAGALGGLLASILVIKAVFSTTTEKAFLVWIFNVFAHIVAILIGIFTFASGLSAIFHRW